jgi:hypothetical protein
VTIRTHFLTGAIVVAAFSFAFGQTVSAIAAPTPVGAVSEVKLIAYGTPPEGERAPVFHNDNVVLNETLETIPDGALKANLIDETVLYIGSNGRLTVDEMVYDPATHKGHSLIKLAEGTFHFISGLMEKPNVHIETPSATIGIRGTEFSVHVDKTGATSVNVIHGMVQLASKRTRRNVLIPGGSHAAASETGSLTPVRAGRVKTGDKFIDAVDEKAAKAYAKKIQKAEKEDRESNGLAKAVGLSDEDLKGNNGVNGLAKALGNADDKESQGANGLAIGNGSNGKNGNGAVVELAKAEANGLGNGATNAAANANAAAASVTKKALNLLPGKLQIVETPAPTTGTGQPAKTYRLNKRMKVILADVQAPDAPVVAETSRSGPQGKAQGEITETTVGSDGIAKGTGQGTKDQRVSERSTGASSVSGAVATTGATAAAGPKTSNGNASTKITGGATKPVQSVSASAPTTAASTPKPVVQTVTTPAPKAAAPAPKPVVAAVSAAAPKPVANIVKPAKAAVKPTVPKGPTNSNRGKSKGDKKK